VSVDINRSLWQNYLADHPPPPPSIRTIYDVKKLQDNWLNEDTLLIICAEARNSNANILSGNKPVLEALAFFFLARMALSR
jgi:hypothetical protein